VNLFKRLRGNFTTFEELYGGQYRTVGVSALGGFHLDRFDRAVFDALGVIRICTKAPGKKPELSTPYILRCGKTVLDAARHLHRDFAEHLKFARLYRIGGGQSGSMVERHRVLQDQYILEFHL